MKFDFSEIVDLKGITNVYTNNFPKPLLKKSLEDSKLPEDTQVLYLWKKYNSNEALIVTPDLISYINENKYSIIFHLNKISKVYFLSNSIFYLHDLKGEKCGIIPARFFGLESQNVITEFNREAIRDFFNSRISTGNFKYDVDEFYEIAIKEIEDLGDINEMGKLEQIQQEEYADKIISIYDDFTNKHGKSQLYYSLEFFLALALSIKKENIEALKIVDNIIDNYSEGADLELWYFAKAEILSDTSKIYDSAIYFKKAYDLTNDTLEKLNYKKRINELTEKFNINFSELPIQERKLILISDDIKKIPANSFIVLDENNLPQNLIFPNSHPKSKELYIAHPYLKESYLSFSTYETNLSADKFDEFFYFVQCLGAKKITYKVLKGNNITQNKLKNINADLSLSIGKAPIKNEGNISFEKENQYSTQQETSNARAKTQTFNPVKAPYIPDDLIWYPHEIIWHRLFQQRINGNILNHHEIISSKNSLSINESEKASLKLAFKNFFVDANINVGQLIEENFSQNESVEWEIEIEFESIENLKETHVLKDLKQDLPNVTNDVEKDYLEEVKYMLEDDGLVDDKERRILERFRERKGLSKQRAIELEARFNTIGNLEENEKEYLEEYKELLNEGEITEKERRILDRFAVRLEIATERIKALELSVNK
ncbi:MAG: hypothetical protein H7239_13090 [Flavobacterium sp.]|nr:hypothetical protein [Flavobacterium sp.]